MMALMEGKSSGFLFKLIFEHTSFNDVELRVEID